jgi:hypothetical protein
MMNETEKIGLVVFSRYKCVYAVELAVVSSQQCFAKKQQFISVTSSLMALVVAKWPSTCSCFFVSAWLLNYGHHVFEYYSNSSG